MLSPKPCQVHGLFRLQRFMNKETGFVVNLGSTEHSRILFSNGETWSTMQHVQREFKMIVLRPVKL